jgi:hypothetical protein
MKLEILKLENIFNLKISSLVYKIIIRKTDVPKALINLTMEASDVHTSYNTRYASKQNLIQIMQLLEQIMDYPHQENFLEIRKYFLGRITRKFS